jgi:hypothetical protein
MDNGLRIEISAQFGHIVVSQELDGIPRQYVMLDGDELVHIAQQFRKVRAEWYSEPLTEPWQDAPDLEPPKF